MNTRSRFHARRMMYMERRKLLSVLKDAVWLAHVSPGPYADGIMTGVTKREDADLAAEAYYVARSMAHYARQALR